MLAMNFRGPFRIRADRNRPDPEIKHPFDAIVRVTRSPICGSDLHLQTDIKLNFKTLWLMHLKPSFLLI